MTNSIQSSDDHSWEKVYAPKVGKWRIVLISAIYIAWIGLLAYLAIQRWFISAF